MARGRDYIALKVQLAAALAQLASIPHEHRKSMTADQVISLFERHHDPIAKGIDGCDEHWNIQWTLILAHSIITNTETKPLVARAKRISKSTEEFRQRLLVKGGLAEPVEPAKPKRKWGSRPMQSRNSFQALSRDGRRPFKRSS